MDIELKLHYFTASACSVCDSLLPKMQALISQQFPQVILEIHSVEESPKIAADFGVFTVPVAILSIDGKESERWVRSFGIIEIQQKLQRIASLIN